jgi:hypothetical protein
MQKKKGNAVVVSATPQPMESFDESTSKVTPMETEVTNDDATLEVEISAEEQIASTPNKGKKQKKKSYKSMMSGMMHTNSPERDVEKDKDALRQITGGGVFSKIEKI